MIYVDKCPDTGLKWYYDAESMAYVGLKNDEAQSRILGKYLPSNPKSYIGIALTKHWGELNANTNN